MPEILQIFPKLIKIFSKQKQESTGYPPPPLLPGYLLKSHFSIPPYISFTANKLLVGLHAGVADCLDRLEIL